MIHVQQNGRLYYFDYLVHAHRCSRVEEQMTMFTSQIVVYKTVNGPKPMLQKAIITTDTPTTTSQSFLVQYWYVFLPLLLFVLFAPGE
jgi:hypothetical protein